MTKQEMYNEIKSRQLKSAEILDRIAEEKRELTNVERVTLDTYKEEIADLEKRMSTPEIQPSRILKVGGGLSDNKFSLTSFFRNLADNRSFTDLEKEIVEMGKKDMSKNGLAYRGTVLPYEFRATLAAGTASVGQELVPEDKFDLIMPLRAKSVIAKAGATLLTNLSSNISIPVMNGSTAAWKGENVAAADGTNGFTEVEYSPKRLTVYLPVSKLLLIQSSATTEAKLQADLVNAINSKLEETFLGTASGSTTQPAGLFYGSTYCGGAVTGTTDWSKVVTLETTINTSNADVSGMAYILHPSTLGKFKTTQKTATYGDRFIAEDSLINGYNYLTTTHMPTISSGKGIVFGNFNDFYMNFWSGMDIVVDNLTGAKEGIVNYIINLYVDGGPIRSASFATGWLS